MANYIQVAQYLYLGNAADVKPTGVPLPTHCWELDTKTDYATKDGTNWVAWRVDPSGQLSTINTEVQTTTVASGGGSVATTVRLGLIVRWIADAINGATSGLAALKAILDTSGVILNAKTAAFLLLAGNQQTFTKQITSAANAGAVTVATITTQACKIKSIVVRSNGATTANLTSIAVLGGASSVVTFIDATTGLRANIAAADQQVSWDGRATLAATKTITITLTGTGAAAVDLQVDIEYEAIADGGYLV